MTYVPWGETLKGASLLELSNEPLQRLYWACQNSPFFDIVEVREVKTEYATFQAIVVEAGDGCVAGRNAVGIRPRERIALHFHPAFSMPPDVRALRADFPSSLHLNPVHPGEPKSLCLSELTWPALERDWTAEKHLQSILRWLAKTADATLHQPDQALEQIFYGNGLTLLLPSSFAAHANDPSKRLRITDLQSTIGTLGTIATAEVVDANANGTKSRKMRTLSFAVPAVSHIAIADFPKTLGDLEQVLLDRGSALLPSMNQAICNFAKAADGAGIDNSNQPTLLLISFPRDVDGRIDLHGFVTDIDLAELGCQVGILHRAVPNGAAHVFESLFESDESTKAGTLSKWRDISVDFAEIKWTPSRSQSQHMSGIDATCGDFVGVLAGVGALGSHMADIWTREAWGYWNFVDEDLLLSHNPIRHIGGEEDIGKRKVDVVKDHMQRIRSSENIQMDAIAASASNLADSALRNLYDRAQLAVDVTTTLDVPRDWSAQDAFPRTATAFVTPSGLSSVLFVEDAGRLIRGASLEAQYCRALLNEQWGENLLGKGVSKRIGLGCRDRSFILSTELIQLHAATLSRRLRKAVEFDHASISVWKLDDATGDMAHYAVKARHSQKADLGNWKVIWDEGFEEKVFSFRTRALPFETGGILLGIRDHKLKTIHLVDVLPAPIDSVSTVDSFVRGEEGLSDAFLRTSERSNHIVDYVGEWHSHPSGVSSRMSEADKLALAQLALRLADDGVPALMLIASETNIAVTFAELSR